MIIIVFECGSFIFPLIDDDEYFVDEYGCCHDNNCSLRDVPWFTKKYNKYDFLLKHGQKICRECLLLEENKLWRLHYINLELREQTLRYNGATEDYIEKEMQKYY